eukprot:COSAG05_NODE_24331_length_252_cov_0.673203_2_plen_43_part_01
MPRMYIHYMYMSVRWSWLSVAQAAAVLLIDCTRKLQLHVALLV